MAGTVATFDLDTSHVRFQQLLEQHRGIVFKVANTYCGDREDVRDLAQEICAQLWHAFPGYDPARRFSTWMYRVALNVAISHIRSVRHPSRDTVPFDAELHDAAVDGTPRHEVDEPVRALHRFIGTLEPLNRALLLLYLDECSHREIADVLGLSETNVATKISRLKQRIRDEL